MIKAYKYRLYPTREQCVFIEQHFNNCRFIYNWALDSKIKAYETKKEKLSCFTLINALPALKKENIWLSKTYSQCLQMSIRNLDNAFTAFFQKNSKFPKFKSKRKSKPSCQYPQGIDVDFEKQEVSFPKIGNVRAILHRRFDGKIKTCTLSKTPSDKYFISILVEDKNTLPNKETVTEDTTLGIDVGLKHFATLSDSRKIDNPHFFRKAEKRLVVLQRRMSKKQKTSKNRKNVKLVVAKQHEKISNQRSNFLHKLSHSLVRENQTTMIVCENLNVKEMMKTHFLAKSIADVSWSMYSSFLQYKCDWYGKTFQQIGRYEPSSKLCNICGIINYSLTLKDRRWICPNCHTEHDRDINAAINIKKFGYIRFQGTGIELKQSLSERFDIGQERRRKETNCL